MMLWLLWFFMLWWQSAVSTTYRPRPGTLLFLLLSLLFFLITVVARHRHVNKEKMLQPICIFHLHCHVCFLPVLGKLYVDVFDSHVGNTETIFPMLKGPFIGGSCVVDSSKRFGRRRTWYVLLGDTCCAWYLILPKPYLMRPTNCSQGKI